MGLQECSLSSGEHDAVARGISLAPQYLIYKCMFWCDVVQFKSKSSEKNLWIHINKCSFYIKRHCLSLIQSHLHDTDYILLFHVSVGAPENVWRYQIKLIKKRVKCVWTLQEAVNTTRSHVSVTTCFKFAWWNAVLVITELHYYGITINCMKDYMMNRLKDQHHSASIIVSLMLNIGEVCKIKTCRRAFKNVELFATQHRGNWNVNAGHS